MAATDHPIQPNALGEEISRKDLATLIRRFLHLHWQRLQNLHVQLTSRQQDCLAILPLLFHRNHPALPGYGNGLAPAGIRAYSLSPTARTAIRRLVPGFDYRRQGMLEPPIHGLFVMGNAGSDLDLWICHRSDLEDEELVALQVKCAEIEAWAGKQGLKVHCLLIDPERFRQGQLEPQHSLILEEFYRTAVHLAGCTLLWWLVPPEQENHYREYADYLIGKHFIDPDSVIDLGGLDNVPADELASATIKELDKALTSPYQALLKLQLLLDYAAAYPDPKWLATSIKAAVYAGKMEAEALDPYLCLYQRVKQTLLTHGQDKLLPLIQRCFLSKIHPALNLKALTQNLGLDPASSSLAGTRPQRIEQVEAEWQILVQALEQNYRFISQFSSQHNVTQIVNENLKLLGRKLRATLERRPDKVEIVQLVPEAGLPEATLSLSQERGADAGWYWRLDRNRVRAPKPLYQGRHLLQVIAWAQVNGVDCTGSQWTLLPGLLPLELAELRFLTQTIRRWLDNRPNPPLEAYRQPARLTTAQLFLNIAIPTRPQRSGFEVTSERFDPLGYGADRCVLIHNLEVLSYNSWGEIQVYRYQGLEGLLDCFCRLYEQSRANTEIQAHCFSSKAIARRVTDLYQALAQTLRWNPASWFILQAGMSLYVFRYRENHLDWWQCEDEAALTEALGLPRAEFTPVVFDPPALEDSPLPFLYRHNQAGKVQLFLWPHHGRVEVLVLDERGALYRQNYPNAPPQAVLHRYVTLLKALDQRYPGSGEVECAWLERTAKGWRLRAAEVTLPLAPAIQVRVYAQEVCGDSPCYTLVCNDREFSSRELGDQVFAKAARYIQGFRRSSEEYPFYVSDLDVPARLLGLTSSALRHTACLLAYKRKIEQRLNQ